MSFAIIRSITRECLVALIGLPIGFIAIPIIIAIVAPHDTTRNFYVNLGYVLGMLFNRQEPYINPVVIWSLMILPYILIRLSFLVQRINEFFTGLGSIVLGMMIVFVGLSTCPIWFSLSLAFLLHCFFGPKIVLLPFSLSAKFGYPLINAGINSVRGKNKTEKIELPT